jgi:hypothetical protein
MEIAVFCARLELTTQASADVSHWQECASNKLNGLERKGCINKDLIGDKEIAELHFATDIMLLSNESPV